MPRIETANKGYFLKISEFRIIKKIGLGSFGQVSLAIHKPTKRKYAIKIIDLTDDFSEFQTKLIERQIKMHLALDHPHIIKLWDTLQQNNKIYMIMDYAAHGSLFHYHSNLITKKLTPSNEEVYRFVSQTVSALKYMHSHDYMHRDIKPENILLDENFNIKICDFGWVTNRITTPRTTFCGTYEYMAPQMVFQQSYDYKIDIWAIGVLLYELLHGNAPFSGQDLSEVREKISLGSYEIKRNISPALRNLIIDILQLKPQKRLGIQEILSHPWMKANQNRDQGERQNPKTLINFRNSEQLPSDEEDPPLSLISNDMHNYLKNGKRELKSLLRESSSKQNFTKSKHRTNKRSPIMKSFLNENKETLKKNWSQKRIKKKCKTQGQQELTSYEDYIFFKNLAQKNKNQIIMEEVPKKKTTFLKQGDKNRRYVAFEQGKKMKKISMKNMDKSEKVSRIQKKLFELSTKFYEQKGREQSFVLNTRSGFRKT